MILLHPALELAATEEFIDKDEPGRNYLVAEVEGRAAGSITLHHMQRPRLHHMGILGLMVGRPYWNQGIAGFLMQAALEIADDWLNLYRVELDVFTDNDVAIHLYEKFGFEVEGRRRRVAYGPGGWRDNLLMARLHNADAILAQRSTAEPGALAKRRQGATPAADGDLIIRAPHPDDAQDLHNLYRHPLVARTTLQMPSQTLRLSQRRLTQQAPGLYRYVAELQGRVVGSISLHQSQNAAEQHAAGLGMSVHPDHWGRGIGSALMVATLDLADNWLNISRVALDVNVDNPAGIRLYEKFDFEIEGKRRLHTYGDGRWVDSYFMARIKNRD